MHSGGAVTQNGILQGQGLGATGDLQRALVENVCMFVSCFLAFCAASQTRHIPTSTLALTPWP